MSYYTYLLASLPTLQFRMKPPFSFERFLEICEGLVTESDMIVLKTASLPCVCPSGKDPSSTGNTFEKWRAFDTSLRNELVRIRAKTKHKNPEKYLRCGGYTDSTFRHIALRAHRAHSILEAEEILDGERWQFLDELSVAHYFDLGSMIIYAKKLLILHKWDKIRTLNKEKALESILQ